MAGVVPGGGIDSESFAQPLQPAGSPHRRLLAQADTGPGRRYSLGPSSMPLPGDGGAKGVGAQPTYRMAPVQPIGVDYGQPQQPYSFVSQHGQHQQHQQQPPRQQPAYHPASEPAYNPSAIPERGRARSRLRAIDGIDGDDRGLGHGGGDHHEASAAVALAAAERQARAAASKAAYAEELKQQMAEKEARKQQAKEEKMRYEQQKISEVPQLPGAAAAAWASDGGGGGGRGRSVSANRGLGGGAGRDDGNFAAMAGGSALSSTASVPAPYPAPGGSGAEAPGAWASAFGATGSSLAAAAGDGGGGGGGYVAGLPPSPSAAVMRSPPPSQWKDMPGNMDAASIKDMVARGDGFQRFRVQHRSEDELARAQAKQRSMDEQARLLQQQIDERARQKEEAKRLAELAEINEEKRIQKEREELARREKAADSRANAHDAVPAQAGAQGGGGGSSSGIIVAVRGGPAGAKSGLHHDPDARTVGQTAFIKSPDRHRHGADGGFGGGDGQALNGPAASSAGGHPLPATAARLLRLRQTVAAARDGTNPSHHGISSPGDYPAPRTSPIHVKHQAPPSVPDRHGSDGDDDHYRHGHDGGRVEDYIGLALSSHRRSSVSQAPGAPNVPGLGSGMGALEAAMMARLHRGSIDDGYGSAAAGGGIHHHEQHDAASELARVRRVQEEMAKRLEEQTAIMARMQGALRGGYASASAVAAAPGFTNGPHYGGGMAGAPYGAPHPDMSIAMYKGHPGIMMDGGGMGFDAAARASYDSARSLGSAGIGYPAAAVPSLAGPLFPGAGANLDASMLQLQQMQNLQNSAFAPGGYGAGQVAPRSNNLNRGMPMQPGLGDNSAFAAAAALDGGSVGAYSRRGSFSSFPGASGASVYQQYPGSGGAHGHLQAQLPGAAYPAGPASAVPAPGVDPSMLALQQAAYGALPPQLAQHQVQQAQPAAPTTLPIKPIVGGAALPSNMIPGGADGGDQSIRWVGKGRPLTAVAGQRELLQKLTAAEAAQAVAAEFGLSKSAAGSVAASRHGHRRNKQGGGGGGADGGTGTHTRESSAGPTRQAQHHHESEYREAVAAAARLLGSSAHPGSPIAGHPVRHHPPSKYGSLDPEQAAAAAASRAQSQAQTRSGVHQAAAASAPSTQQHPVTDTRPPSAGALIRATAASVIAGIGPQQPQTPLESEERASIEFASVIAGLGPGPLTARDKTNTDLTDAGKHGSLAGSSNDVKEPVSSSRPASGAASAASKAAAATSPLTAALSKADAAASQDAQQQPKPVVPAFSMGVGPFDHGHVKSSARSQQQRQASSAAPTPVAQASVPLTPGRVSSAPPSKVHSVDTGNHAASSTSTTPIQSTRSSRSHSAAASGRPPTGPRHRSAGASSAGSSPVLPSNGYASAVWVAKEQQQMEQRRERRQQPGLVAMSRAQTEHSLPSTPSQFNGGSSANTSVRAGYPHAPSADSNRRGPLPVESSLDSSTLMVYIDGLRNSMAIRGSGSDRAGASSYTPQSLPSGGIRSPPPPGPPDHRYGDDGSGAPLTGIDYEYQQQQAYNSRHDSGSHRSQAAAGNARYGFPSASSLPGPQSTHHSGRSAAAAVPSNRPAQHHSGYPNVAHSTPARSHGTRGGEDRGQLSPAAEAAAILSAGGVRSNMTDYYSSIANEAAAAARQSDEYGLPSEFGVSRPGEREGQYPRYYPHAAAQERQRQLQRQSLELQHASNSMLLSADRQQRASYDGGYGVNDRGGDRNLLDKLHGDDRLDVSARRSRDLRHEHLVYQQAIRASADDSGQYHHQPQHQQQQGYDNRSLNTTGASDEQHHIHSFLDVEASLAARPPTAGTHANNSRLDNNALVTAALGDYGNHSGVDDRHGRGDRHHQQHQHRRRSSRSSTGSHQRRHGIDGVDEHEPRPADTAEPSDHEPPHGLPSAAALAAEHHQQWNDVSAHSVADASLLTSKPTVAAPLSPRGDTFVSSAGSLSPQHHQQQLATSPLVTSPSGPPASTSARQLRPTSAAVRVGSARPTSARPVPITPSCTTAAAVTTGSAFSSANGATAAASSLARPTSAAIGTSAPATGGAVSLISRNSPYSIPMAEIHAALAANIPVDSRATDASAAAAAASGSGRIGSARGRASSSSPSIDRHLTPIAGVSATTAGSPPLDAAAAASSSSPGAIASSAIGGMQGMLEHIPDVDVEDDEHEHDETKADDRRERTSASNRLDNEPGAAQRSRRHSREGKEVEDEEDAHDQTAIDRTFGSGRHGDAGAPESPGLIVAPNARRAAREHDDNRSGHGPDRTDSHSHGHTDADSNSDAGLATGVLPSDLTSTSRSPLSGNTAIVSPTATQRKAGDVATGIADDHSPGRGHEAAPRSSTSPTAGAGDTINSAGSMTRALEFKGIVAATPATNHRSLSPTAGLDASNSKSGGAMAKTTPSSHAAAALPPSGRSLEKGSGGVISDHTSLLSPVDRGSPDSTRGSPDSVSKHSQSLSNAQGSATRSRSRAGSRSGAGGGTLSQSRRGTGAGTSPSNNLESSSMSIGLTSALNDVNAGRLLRRKSWGLSDDDVAKHKQRLLAFYTVHAPEKASEQKIDDAWELFGPAVWEKLRQKYREKVAGYAVDPVPGQISTGLPSSRPNSRPPSPAAVPSAK